MENIISTFYKGNINKFGFGGWNSTKNNIPEILAAYPYPSNANRQIGKYFQKSNVDPEGKSKHLHVDYVPNIYNQNIPPGERVDFSKSNAMDIKPISTIQYKNFDNHGFMTTQEKPVPDTNFSPALIRMEYLENKVRDLENKNRAEMIKSLNEVNDKFIDPRFKHFLDHNQGKYDVFGNDPDPLDQRRQFVQNNLGSMRNKLDMEERKERKKKRKKEKKLKKKKKKKNKFFDVSESGGEEENENELGNNTMMTTQNNGDERNGNLSRLNSGQVMGSQNITPMMTQKSITNNRNQFRRASLVQSLKNTRNSIMVQTKNSKRDSVARRSSVKRTSIKRNSLVSKQDNKNEGLATIESKEIKPTKEVKEVKVCGDIGYSFTGVNKREKELQFQTNRLGKDFDKLLNEIKEFKKVIKDKINVQNNDEMNRLNIYKDIFLLDNKAKMKFAVDKIINRSNETFNSVEYQKKIDNEKQAEINEIINKKIDEYNYNRDKTSFANKIYNERRQMMNDNIINRYEYQKYRDKLNNQIMSLPNIYIQATKNTTKNRQSKKKEENQSDDKNKSKKEVDKENVSKISKISGKNKSAYVNEISEETILDFGSFINGNDQLRTKLRREISRRSETYVDPSENKKKNLIPLVPIVKENNKSIKNTNKEEEGKDQLIKAINEKEKKESSKTTKKKSIKKEEEKKEKEKEEKAKKEKEEKEKKEKKSSIRRYVYIWKYNEK